MNLRAFEALEDFGKGKVAFDLALVFTWPEMTAIFDGDVIPAGKLDHDTRQVFSFEMEVAIFPGNDFVNIYTVLYLNWAAFGNTSPVTWFEQGFMGGVCYFNGAFEQGHALQR